MKKTLLLTLLIFISSVQAAFAEKIPVRITPTEIISTKRDETDIGDWISFAVVNDVYINDKLYIKKGTPIHGFVDFFHQNGWAGDSAEIKFKTFKTIDIDGNKITIDYPLNIDGKNKKAKDLKQYIAWKLLILVRGAEIYITPDEKFFNIFIER